MSDRPGKTPQLDAMRMLAEFRLPQMTDLEGLAQAQRRNLEALSAANRVALEGAQMVARRHMEIVQQSMTEMTEAMRGITANESPQAHAARQTELLKAGYERAVGNMKELADLIQRSNAEALSLLNKRFTDAMEEVKTMVQKGGKA